MNECLKLPDSLPTLLLVNYFKSNIFVLFQIIWYWLTTVESVQAAVSFKLGNFEIYYWLHATFVSGISKW